MGFHHCPAPDNGYVHGCAEPYYSNKSSADHELTFTSGRSWRMPTAILYYIFDCGWQPDTVFIDDVMHHSLARPAQNMQTRGSFNAGVAPIEKRAIGYLSDNFVKTALPTAPWTAPYARADIARKLEEHLSDYSALKHQTKGPHPTR